MRDAAIVREYAAETDLPKDPSRSVSVKSRLSEPRSQAQAAG